MNRLFKRENGKDYQEEAGAWWQVTPAWWWNQPRKEMLRRQRLLKTILLDEKPRTVEVDW